ncbi:MAG: hypothetical protein JNK27_04105 [Chitinophagaceae bacterium]|nr:hypothetical protein [Chitinophagaceae bacterium]
MTKEMGKGDKEKWGIRTKKRKSVTKEMNGEGETKRNGEDGTKRNGEENSV